MRAIELMSSEDFWRLLGNPTRQPLSAIASPNRAKDKHDQCSLLDAACAELRLPGMDGLPSC